jgi:hypothetical protein
MTRTAPLRRITLHFSHMGLTDARTFMAPWFYLPIERMSAEPRNRLSANGAE